MSSSEGEGAGNDADDILVEVENEEDEAEDEDEEYDDDDDYDDHNDNVERGGSVLEDEFFYGRGHNNEMKTIMKNKDKEEIKSSIQDTQQKMVLETLGTRYSYSHPSHNGGHSSPTRQQLLNANTAEADLRKWKECVWSAKNIATYFCCWHACMSRSYRSLDCRK